MQKSGMNEDHWIWPDRHELYRSCIALVDPIASAELIGRAVDALLNDLELYDDPQQGSGSWLFSDELPLADDLARLHAIVGPEPKPDCGAAVLAHPIWKDARSSAERLVQLIRQNGQGSAANVR
jgi:hypothetical protein